MIAATVVVLALALVLGVAANTRYRHWSARLVAGEVGALVLLAMVFASVQIAIFETDGKFGGLIRVDPDEMRLILSRMDVALEGVALPCDDQGRPL